MKKIPPMKLTTLRLKKKIKKERFSLSLSFTLVVLLVLLASLAIASLTVYLLAYFGAIGSLDGPNAGYVILSMTVISTIIGLTGAFLIGKIPLKPVNRWINNMNRLSEGDFNVRMSFGKPFGKAPAMVELSDSFNKLAEELQKTEMLRSDFINNFSHEVKTPIVSIAGFAKLLKRGDLTEEQRIQYLDAIEEESMRLSYMATNVLNLTKVENQTILTDICEFNLSEQIRSSVLLLESKWEKKEIDLQLDFDEYTVEGNEEMLKQIWINLIDNAVKFVPHGGVVSIDIQSTEKILTVCISNTGEDIPADKIEKIWRKFYQVDESHSSEGNGIGLAIVKRIADLHGGDVDVKSEGGTTSFFVRLPKKQ